MVDGAGGYLIPGLWDMHVHSVANVALDQGMSVNPARVLGMTGSLGTVETGKLADLVLLDGDPLADIRNTRRIRAVVADAGSTAGPSSTGSWRGRNVELAAPPADGSPRAMDTLAG